MAILTTSDRDFDDFIHNLEMLGEDAEEVRNEMLAEGSNVMAMAWKNGIRENKHVDTGDMLNAVKTSIKAKSGIAEIYPKGKDRKGVRNAEKAFIVNYGTSSMQGDRFVEKLEQEAEDDVYDAMERVMDDYISKNGL